MGQSRSRMTTRFFLSKMTVAASGSEPLSHTILFSGFDLKPPILVILF